MINDSMLADLKKSLRRERRYVEIEQRSKIIDTILKRFDHVEVFYIRSENPANSVKFLEPV